MAANTLPSVNTKTYGGLDFRAYQELKNGIHRYLLNEVDLERISAAPDDRTRSQVFAVIQDVVSNLKVPLSGPEKERLSIDILNEVFGLGPLEPLMQDPDISDILINGAKEVYVERAGILEETKIVFKDDAHLMRVINKIVSAIGRRVDESSPMTEGKGEVKPRQLVINSLRMRPNRIVVGEVRGEEAFDMLQAMNTGHDGSLTTIHANSPRDALARMETMAMMASLNLPEKAIRKQIASAVTLILQVARFSDGTRRLTHVTEITGMEGDVISMQDLFVFEKRGVSSDGRVVGIFTATGIRPKFAERLKAGGFDLPSNMFEPTSRH
jgi:Flp pilus assembly CpaF family ATPase